MEKQELIEYLTNLGYSLDESEKDIVKYTKEYQVKKDSKTKAKIEYHLSKGKVSLVYTCMNIKQTRMKGKLKEMSIKDGVLLGMKDII